MEPFAMEIVIEVVKAIVGVAIPALTVYLAFYTKRINEKMERKALQAEVDRLTNFAQQSRSFEIMDYDSRVAAVVESVRLYALKNDMTLHDNEIQMLVEASFGTLRALEGVGLKLYQLKLSEDKHGKTIEE
jgi:hypothetical protein